MPCQIIQKAYHGGGDFQKEIEEITSQIVEKYRPERIILFGSSVAGDFTKDSDLDFVIIKSHLPHIGRERARNLRTLIRKKVPADFLIYQPDEFDNRLRMGDPFLKLVMKEGEIVYGT